eukprot:g327.t1
MNRSSSNKNSSSSGGVGSVGDGTRYDVVIRVYDISRGMARSMSAMAGLRFDAIYHTGVLVYGKEYFFGGVKAFRNAIEADSDEKNQSSDGALENPAARFARAALRAVGEKTCTTTLPWFYLLRIACLDSSLSCALRIEIVDVVARWIERGLEIGVEFSDPALLMAYVALSNSFALHASAVRGGFSDRLVKLSDAAIRSKVTDAQGAGRALRSNATCAV